MAAVDDCSSLSMQDFKQAAQASKSKGGLVSDNYSCYPVKFSILQYMSICDVQ